jgi:6,7-dimethyl-8-ribityllumazine synthase
MIAIIKSAFNIEITDLLEKGCATYLTEQQLPFTIFNCPGAIGTVVYANKLIQTGKYKSIIVIGAIIKGDTDHYEYVCQYVTNGISQLSAMHTTPIIFGILTVQNEELAYERAALDRMNKGKEFGETAKFMINAFERL